VSCARLGIFTVHPEVRSMAPDLDVRSPGAATRPRATGVAVATPATASEERCERIIEIVRSGSYRSIRDLALQCKLSESYVQHLFRARTGSSLGRSLTGERLRKAADLLQRSDMSIKEIAFISGYKHPSSFIRAFDRVFRRTPACYRQEMLTESSSC